MKHYGYVKKYALVWILSASVLILGLGNTSRVHADWSDRVITGQALTSKPSSCSQKDIYLHQDKDEDWFSDKAVTLMDNFWYNWSATKGYEACQIYDATFGYYSKLPNMIYKLDASGAVGTIDNQTFYIASWVFPYNTPIRWIDTAPNMIVLESPSDKDITKNTITVQYNYMYKTANGLDTTRTSNYRYQGLPNKDYFGYDLLTLKTLLPWTNGNTRRTWSETKNSSVCSDFNIHRCGDGKIDNQTWYTITWSTTITKVTYLFTGFEAEICDDGPLNGTAGYCDTNCRWWGLKCSTDPTVSADQIECDNGVENNGNDEKCTLSCTVEVTIIPDLIRDEL